MDADASTPLLYALRNDLGLNSPRFGCGLAQCGACTVLADGTPIRQALNGNLCRCGTHTRILRAVRRAAEPSP